MCEASTIIAIGAAVVGGVYSAKQQRQMGQYQQDVAEENAKFATAQAENAKQAGNVEEERARARVRQVLASQRAAFAANNVEVSGSAMDILGDTAGQGFADAALIRSNAVREAWGFGVNAQNERQRGRAARWNANAGATGTLLSTGAQAAWMWSQAGYGGGVSGGVGGGD